MSDENSAAPISGDLVPVKTKYPGPPPANEHPLVRWDWIQATAALLAGDWLNLIQRRELLFRWMEQAGRKWIDDDIRDHELRLLQDEWNRHWHEVVPLFNTVRADFPLEAWSKFENIRTPHDAEREPAKAVSEWEHVRDYALDHCAKIRKEMEIGVGKGKPPGVAEPVTLQQISDYAKIPKRTLEGFKTNGEMPPPALRGGRGKADHWNWPDVVPWLRTKAARQLPNHFPGFDEQ